MTRDEAIAKHLKDKDLHGADLRGADLHGADLRGADLRGADLYGADLRGADLYGADLHGADLRGADLHGAKNISALMLATLLIVPTGQFDGWKKCAGGTIVHVRIPSAAKRSNATGRKCRASYVRVLEVFNGTEGISIHDGKTKYIAGKTVKCDKWEEDRFVECGGGIHFYLTREEAEAH